MRSVFLHSFFLYIRERFQEEIATALLVKLPSKMKKILLFLTALVCVSELSAQRFRTDTIYFDFDHYEVREDFRPKLDSLIREFTRYPSYYIEIIGHTDSIGPEPYNVELSQKRARAVTIYMLEHGVDLNRVYYEGHGTQNPLGNNDTYAGRRMNRRAEVAIVFNRDKFVPTLPTPTEPVVVVPSGPTPEELAAMARPDTIHCDYAPFLINPRKNTFIIAPQGSTVLIPANAFVTDAENVSIEINELFLRSDMLLNAMTTIGRDGPLEMVGLVEVDAKVNGRPVKLQPETVIQLSVPGTRKDDYMKVYYGVGGSRASRTTGKASPTTATMTPVKTWNEEPDTKVDYKPRDGYTFGVTRLGRFGVGRQLYYSQITDRDDQGVDFQIALKGKIFERTTTGIITGETVKTYIPLNKKTPRLYVATGVKFVNEKTPLYLVIYEYDEAGKPYMVRRLFKISNEITPVKKGRPVIKLKAKFLPYDPDRFKELLLELNV